LRQDNPVLTAISLKKTSDSMGAGLGGVLGMPVLSRMVRTIDHLKGAVGFEFVKP